jgi:dihydroxyacetone kinase-like predicted kinase
MAHFTDAAVAAKSTSKKASPKAYMSWQLADDKGNIILKENGKPMLQSENNADLALFGIDGYSKSKAEERLIEGAKAKNAEDEVLELTLKVKVKYYSPKSEEENEDYENALWKAMGVI